MQPNQTDTKTVQQTEGGGTVASSVLFGDVYVVVIEDRHCDTSVEVWTDREAAIARARDLAKEYCRHQDDYHEEIIQGWEFYVRYSCEGDSTRVVKTTVRQSPNDQDHRPGACGARSGTEALPPGSVDPLCSAFAHSL